jgi:4-amino-4-deoxychorismate lyase
MSACLASWVDGQPADRVPLDDRGLQYGDGLFETCVVRDGRMRFIEAHLARLANGCARLGIHCDLDVVRGDIELALRAAPARALLKIIVTRGSGRYRGYAPRDAGWRRIVQLFGGAPLHDDQRAMLGLARMRLSATPALAGLKHLNRLENVLAVAEVRPPEFDVLLLDEDGNIAGGSMCNLFLLSRGVLETPRVDRCGIAGIMRGIVMREAALLGLRCVERSLRLADLERADELFVTNARIGVVPVTRVGEHAFDMHVVTLKLRSHIESLDA